MATEVELLTEIRDLLQIIAEPQIAERDRRLRDGLRTAVGRSLNGQKAVLLMDDSRKQAEIVKEGGIGKGQLSPLVKNVLAVHSVSMPYKSPNPSDLINRRICAEIEHLFLRPDRAQQNVIRTTLALLGVEIAAQAVHTVVANKP